LEGGGCRSDLAATRNRNSAGARNYRNSGVPIFLAEPVPVFRSAVTSVVPTQGTVHGRHRHLNSTCLADGRWACRAQRAFPPPKGQIGPGPRTPGGSLKLVLFYMRTPYIPHAIAMCCMLLSIETGLTPRKTSTPEYPKFRSYSGIFGIVL
jgi:hypothetical protein